MQAHVTLPAKANLAALNIIISSKIQHGTSHWRTVQFPFNNQPRGSLTSDDQRPAGLTLIPWLESCFAPWHVIFPDAIAVSYVGSSSSHAPSTAEAAANLKLDNNFEMFLTHHFLYSFRNYRFHQSGDVFLINSLLDCYWSLWWVDLSLSTSASRCSAVQFHLFHLLVR